MKPIEGFFIGVLLTTLFWIVLIDDAVDSVNVEAINRAIEDCETGYRHVKVIEDIDTKHSRTKVSCKDNTTVVLYHKFKINN